MTDLDFAHDVCLVLFGMDVAGLNLSTWPEPWLKMLHLAQESKPDLAEFERRVLAEFNGTGQHFADTVLTQVRQEKAATKTFERYDLYDFIKRPDKEWLLDKFLGVNDFGMLFGPPGKGKTFVTLDLIFSLITGQVFAGQFGVKRPLRVLYCTDEGIDGLKHRLLALMQRYNPPRDSFAICLTMPQLFLDVETGWKHFVAENADFKPDLIILDTLFNAMVGAKENVADDASVAIHNAKAIKAAMHCAMLFLHHSNKGGDWPRGTSAWMGSMDLIAQIDNFTLSCFKAKDGPTFTSLGFELEAQGESVVVKWTGVKESVDGPGSLGEVAYQFLKTNAGQKYTARELGQIFDVSQSSLKREIDKFVARGLVQAAPRNPNIQASSANPTVYWVADPHAGIKFGGLNV